MCCVIFALVHSDIWDLNRAYSTLGYSHLVTFINYVYGCYGIFLTKYCFEIQNHFHSSIKILQINNTKIIFVFPISIFLKSGDFSLDIM